MNEENDPITEALDLLEREGFFVQNLWHIQDVMNNFDCTPNEAQEVLLEAVCSDYIMTEINISITDKAEAKNLKPKQENE